MRPRGFIRKMNEGNDELFANMALQIQEDIDRAILDDLVFLMINDLKFGSLMQHPITKKVYIFKEFCNYNKTINCYDDDWVLHSFDILGLIVLLKVR